MRLADTKRKQFLLAAGGDIMLSRIIQSHCSSILRGSNVLCRKSKIHKAGNGPAFVATVKRCYMPSMTTCRTQLSNQFLESKEICKKSIQLGIKSQRKYHTLSDSNPMKHIMKYIPEKTDRHTRAYYEKQGYALLSSFASLEVSPEAKKATETLINEVLAKFLPLPWKDQTPITFVEMHPSGRAPATYQMVLSRMEEESNTFQHLLDLRVMLRKWIAKDQQRMSQLDAYKDVSKTILYAEKGLNWLLKTMSPQNAYLFDRITPATPLDYIVSVLISEDTVHSVYHERQVLHRMGVGRRWHSLFHPLLLSTTACCVEVAFLNAIPSSTRIILDPEVQGTPEEQATHAIFYSIITPHKGFADHNIGKLLLEKTMQQIKDDLKNITTFATISPIPNFRESLIFALDLISSMKFEKQDSKTPALAAGTTMMKKSDRVLKVMREAPKRHLPPMACLLRDYDFLPEELESLNKACFDVKITPTPNPLLNLRFLLRRIFDLEVYEKIAPLLMRLAANYLVNVKEGTGKPSDPVARFHLRNGAMIYRINWAADISFQRTHESFGIMVNYLYKLDQMSPNAELFKKSNVPYSLHVQKVLQGRFSFASDDVEKTGAAEKEAEAAVAPESTTEIASQSRPEEEAAGAVAEESDETEPSSA